MTPPNERPTAEGAQQSLRDHVMDKAVHARKVHADLNSAGALAALLLDRAVVRYPLGIRFDSQPLQSGEFACLEALGGHPSDGFCLFIHPMFENVVELHPLIVAYYIPSVNYGEVASHVEAELFGAALCGLDVEEYYKILCSVADTVEHP
jgi:hypothetical protein